MNFDILFTVVLLLLLTVAFPFMGMQDFRLLMRRTREGDADARTKFYKEYLIWLWPLTIGLSAWWLLSGNGLESLGLIPVAAGRQWIVIGIAALVMLAQVIYMEWAARNAESLAKVKNQMGDLSNLAPQTDAEGRLFTMVSITAGVCEEILYRGLLFATLVPLVGTWPAVGISSLIFGLGHAYQGISGIVKTGMVGLTLALLTVFSGSLFAAIVLHAVIDLASGRIMGRALRVPPLQTA